MKFSISYPVKPYVVNQPFGVNGAYYQAHGIPINGHNGLDLQASHGQPVYAVHDGIAYYEVDEDQGHGVVVHSDQQFDDGQGGQCFYKTIYWHLCDSAKEPQFISPIEGTAGLPVKAGDLIGYADTTGLSTGDHLHFGLKPEAKQNEPPYMWYNVLQQNGFLGCIDPTPFFNGKYASDIQVILKQEISLAQKVVLLLKQLLKL